MDFLEPLKNRILANVASIVVGYTMYQLNNFVFEYLPVAIGKFDAGPGTTETDIRQVVLIAYATTLYRNLLGFVRKYKNM